MQSMMHDYECKEKRISKEFTLKEKFLVNIWMENTYFINIERRLQQFFLEHSSYNDKINDKTRAKLIKRLRLMKNQMLDAASTSGFLSHSKLSAHLSRLLAC